jgi:tetratricopeptide (TPR) repeat protein
MNKPFTAIAALSISVIAAGAVSAQDEARKLFEAGQYQAAIQRTTPDGSPEAKFLQGLAYRKLNQNDQAKDAFRSLEQGDDAWKAVGESAITLVDGNLDQALASASAAVERNPGLSQAHYQLGLVQEARGDAGAAAEAFARSADANPQMAYAHFNAGMNFYKIQRVDRMAVYFENFLKLAPKAPERPAVESIMRTVRGR